MMKKSHGTDIAQFRQSILTAAHYLRDTGVLSHSLHGNISIRIPGTDTLLLTSKSTLGPALTIDDLPIIDLDGNVIEGELDPISAEIIHMHTAVYLKRPDIGSVIHTHSPHATAFAVASKPIECIYEGLARFDMVDPVPVAKYGPRGSAESVQNIVDVLGKRSKAVLLENHGILTFERDALTAARVAVVLEEAAELAIRASLIGQPKVIPREMATYAQERAAEFARKGKRRAK